MGIVFDIQKFSVHDGPGIRTTVFLKGCNIRCQWCHNPESFSKKPQLSYENGNCIQCRACENVCPQGVHTFVQNEHLVDFSKCSACGVCAENCMFQALKIFGKEMTSEQVLQEILKDKKYYQTSGGGVTVSGGEPSVQYEFLLEILQKCKDNGIHTCIETNGIMEQDKCRNLSRYTDLFLLDYKATGEELHKALTRAGNKKMLENLEMLDLLGKEVILRCPVIPGLNDKKEHFEAIKHLKEKHRNITKVEIMAYHSLGKFKWDSLGLAYTLSDIKDVSAAKKQEWELSIKD